MKPVGPELYCEGTTPPRWCLWVLPLESVRMLIEESFLPGWNSLVARLLGAEWRKAVPVMLSFAPLTFTSRPVFSVAISP